MSEGSGHQEGLANVIGINGIRGASEDRIQDGKGAGKGKERDRIAHAHLCCAGLDRAGDADAVQVHAAGARRTTRPHRSQGSPPEWSGSGGRGTWLQKLFHSRSWPDRTSDSRRWPARASPAVEDGIPAPCVATRCAVAPTTYGSNSRILPEPPRIQGSGPPECCHLRFPDCPGSG